MDAIGFAWEVSLSSPAFLSVCLNPTLQKTLRFPSLSRDTVNRTAEHRLDASGKGVNVTRVLSQLGLPATHLTQLGGDFRQLFLDLCARDGLPVRWVDSGSQIRFCYTAIDSSDKSVTELVEESYPVSSHTESLLLDLFREIVPAYGTLIVSGTKAAGFSDRVVPELTRIAKQHGLRVILDVRGADLSGSLQYGPDVVKPNLHEFLTTYLPGLVGSGVDEETLKEKVSEQAAHIAAEYGSRVVLTRGAHSVWLYEDATFIELAIEAAQPVNTTGSGDAFTAGFAAAMADGATLRDAALEGARCGRLNALLLKPGTIV